MIKQLFNLPDDILKHVIFSFVDASDLMNIEDALRRGRGVGDETEVLLKLFYEKIKDCILEGDTTIPADRSVLTWMYISMMYSFGSYDSQRA